MLPFTYTQKKWALTSCLMLALGFSLSVHQHREGSGMANLASESTADGEIDTANGRVKVTYVKNGEKTLAVVTEGRICTTCENQNFTISTAFKADDVSSMNIALLKYINSEASGTPAPEVAANGDEEETPALNADEKAEKAFEAIKEVCGEQEAQEALTCFSDNFKNLLKGAPTSELKKLLRKEGLISKGGKLDEDLKKISKTKAASFYKAEIAPLITGQVKEARRISLLQFRANNGDQAAREELSLLDDSDYKSMGDTALETVKDLMADLPKDYLNVRRLLTTSQKTIIYDDASSYQTSLNNALTTKDPAEMRRLNLENQTRQASLLQLMDAVKQVNRSGLSDARKEQLIGGSTVSEYSSYVNDYAKLIVDGMALNPLSYSIQSPDGIAGTNLDTRKDVGLFANDDFIQQTTPGVYASPAITLTQEQIDAINLRRAQLGIQTR